ncbi:Oxygen-insensitive NAD(P)H nitroreductase [Lunatimonas lonarensis]|uniref:Oxygen-insensitive NAD(P)H nitroreductase n=2 Tax=Lunatimonas lonarensis TaxID=1232681 RepID=R7ZQ12_9BACT|nr:Oxygen-insensitive NAD(P)H nitroreductase [Lunatimonas lonarensis]
MDLGIAGCSQLYTLSLYGGFNPEEVDSILQLEKLGLGSATMLALGYRDQQADPMVYAPKVRRPMEELLVRI